MDRPLDNLNELGLRVREMHSRQKSGHLAHVLEVENKIRDRKKKEVNFSPPILTSYGRAVFFPRTINAIQGQYGVHKSRLSAIIAAAFLSKSSNSANHLGFEKKLNYNPVVIYMDTERNVEDQFIDAVRSIQILSGIDPCVDIDEFRFPSFISVPRKERFTVLSEYLQKVRSESEKEMVVILDVLTDCITDFNNPADSLELIDLMNEMINKENVTFIAVIHENPGTTKARGHLGTELSNKASTLMQIGYADPTTSQETPILKVSFLKCRSSERHPDIFARYSNESKTLVEVSNYEERPVALDRQHKAPIENIKESIRVFLNKLGETKKTDLIAALSESFGCHENTIRQRIEELIQNQTTFVDGSTITSKVLTEFKKGRVVWLKLSEQVLTS